MKTTTLAIAAATLLGGLSLGAGSASAACANQAGLKAGGAPTGYVAMMSKKKMMMMKKKKMMKKKMM